MATILIVDDDADVRKFLAMVLQETGHRLLEAGDGVEGLQYVRTEHPDLVISDLLMPTMSGFELVRQLRTDPITASVPVIFITGIFQEDRGRRMTEACGVQQLLLKPCSRDELIQAVGKVLAAPSCQTILGEGSDREQLQLLTDALFARIRELEGANRRIEQQVAELNRAEQTRKRAEEHLHLKGQLVTNMAEGVCLVQARDAVIVYVNEQFEKMFGYGSGELLDKPVASLNVLGDRSPEETAAAIICSLTETGVWRGEVQNVRKDGTVFWTYANVSTFEHFEHGTIWISVQGDITERKRAEAALSDSEERLNLAVHAADLGIFEYDHHAGAAYWSPILRAITGLGPEEPASLQGFFNLIYHEDRENIVAAVHQAHSSVGDGMYSVEHRVVRPDGGIRWISASSRTFFADEGDARRPLRTVGIVADITERKRLEHLLHDYSERVQALSHRLLAIQEDERCNLARELHDEFGQVLSAVSINLHNCKRICGPESQPGLDDAVSLVNGAIEQVRKLSYDLRPPALDVLGLETALRGLIELHRERSNLDVQMAGHLDVLLPPKLGIACYRVAQEALTNVVRHAKARHVQVVLKQGDTWLCLVIQDDGIGIDLVSVQKEAAKGKNLGMLGMQERVELAGGRFELESIPGSGTKVCAHFPLAAEVE
jgi:PAS domain S-box-containing protein